MAVTKKNGVAPFSKIARCQKQRPRATRCGGGSRGDSRAFQTLPMVTQSQRDGEVQKGRKALQRGIGCKFRSRSHTKGGIDHRVDGQGTVVFKQRTHGPVDGIRTGSGRLLIAGKPTENDIVTRLFVAVAGQILHAWLHLHDASNPLSFFALTVDGDGPLRRFVHQGGASPKSQGQRSTVW